MMGYAGRMKLDRGWLLLGLIGVGLVAVFCGGYGWQSGTGIEVFKLADRDKQAGEVALDEAGGQVGETGIDGQTAEGEASYTLRGRFTVGPTVDRFGRPVNDD